MALIADAYARSGLKLNFKVNKTSCLFQIRGKGAIKTKQLLWQPTGHNGTLQVHPLVLPPFLLHFARTYLYLGTSMDEKRIHWTGISASSG